jgi:hypothetical protein
MATTTEAEIVKLAPFKPGNCVVVSGDWNACNHASKAIRKVHWPDGVDIDENGNVFPVPLIVIGPATLEVADEKRMNDAGWYRREQS